MMNWAGGRIRDCALVASVSIAARLILEALYHIMWGWASVKHVEIYLYMGVARGTHATAHDSDITMPLLEAFGNLFAQQHLMYGLIGLGIILSGASAALVYLIASSYAGTRQGLIAGLIYGLMVEPLNLSMAGFTHDLVLHPIMLLSIFFFQQGFMNRTWISRITFIVAAIFFALTAGNINEGGYLAFPVAFSFLAGIISKKVGKNERILIGFYYIAVSVLMVCVALPYLNMMLSDLPQGRQGSADVIPSTLDSFFIKYSPFIVLFGLGAPLAWKRGDHIAFSLILFGLLFSIEMSRGTRILNLGIAMACAWAVTSKSHKKAHILSLAAISLAGSFLFLVGATHIFAVMAGSTLLLTASLLRGKNRLAFVIAIATSIALVFVMMVDDGENVVLQTEARIYEHLIGSSDGMILTAWDRGYMAEYISGKKAASTAGHIDFADHAALWTTESQAHAHMKRRNISHILVASSSYNLVEYGGSPNYLIRGGLAVAPKRIPPIEHSELLAIHRLRHGQANDSMFHLVKNKTDPVTSETYMLYEAMDGDSRPHAMVLVENHRDSVENLTVNAVFEAYESSKRLGRDMKPFSRKRAPIISQRFLIHALPVAGKRIGLVSGALLILLFASTVWGHKTKDGSLLLALSILGLAFYGMTVFFADSPAIREKEMETILMNYSGSFEIEGKKTLMLGIPLEFDNAVKWAEFEIVSESKAAIGANASIFADCDYEGFMGVGLVDVAASKKYGKTILAEKFDAPISIREGDRFTLSFNIEKPNPFGEYRPALRHGPCTRTLNLESWNLGVEPIYIYY